jgi:long-subunit acyl-CoA synthetase (AMP-forming)
METSYDYRKYERTPDMADALDTIKAINESTDKYLFYKYSRPIKDLKHMMAGSVQLYGDHVAMYQRFKKGEPYGSITYQELYDDMNGLGTALIAHGLKGKRISVIGENCSQWATAYLAVICGVGVVVPLDVSLPAAQLKEQVCEAEVEFVLCTKKVLGTFKDMVAAGDTPLKSICNLSADEDEDGVFGFRKLIDEGKALIAAGNRDYLDAEINAKEMAVLLFTSGTTGTAKGVMLSHRNICTDLMIAPTVLHVNDWDIFFSVLPIHHTYECTCGFLMPLYKGAAIAYCEGLKYIQKNLQETRPTMFLGVPLIFESLYKAIMKNVRKQGKEKAVSTVLKLNKFTSKVGIDLNKKFLKDILNVFGGRMRVVISGGAAIDPDILQFFNDLGMIAVQGYGLTECAPMAALNPDNHKYMRNASVGHIMPGMQVKIADKGEDGIGEICIKGGNVMMGYYRMPEQTAESIVDGWFHTGDLGYTDDEDFIYITGRKKNVIITANGKNVFPEELEYLLGKVDLVAESMVWAEADEDGQDSTIVATIRPDTEALEAALGAEDAKDEEKVKALLWKYVDEINSKLPSFKCIKKISVRTEDFEKNTAHKIKRFVESNKR